MALYTNSKRCLILFSQLKQDQKIKLNNFDRLVIGASLYYLFIDPRNFDKDELENINNHVQSVKVEAIQQEIAEVMGLISGDSRYRDPDEIACMNELIDLMPSLEEANSMSQLMDKKMKYKPIILNPVVIGEPRSKVRPLVIAEKFGTSNKWLWDIEKFIERKACMSEMYMEYKQNGIVSILLNATWIKWRPFLIYFIFVTFIFRSIW